MTSFFSSPTLLCFTTVRWLLLCYCIWTPIIVITSRWFSCVIIAVVVILILWSANHLLLACADQAHARCQRLCQQSSGQSGGQVIRQVITHRLFLKAKLRHYQQLTSACFSLESIDGKSLTHRRTDPLYSSSLGRFRDWHYKSPWASTDQYTHTHQFHYPAHYYNLLPKDMTSPC